MHVDHRTDAWSDPTASWHLHRLGEGAIVILFPSEGSGMVFG